MGFVASAVVFIVAAVEAAAVEEACAAVGIWKGAVVGAIMKGTVVGFLQQHIPQSPSNPIALVCRNPQFHFPDHSEGPIACLEGQSIVGLLESLLEQA